MNMMFKIENKRGLETKSAVVYAILAIISFFILLSITYRIKTVQSQGNWEEVCYDSVTVMASSVALTQGHYASQLKCPTKYYEVKKDGIYSEGKLIRRFSKGNMPEVLEEAISDDLAECWSAFHRGSLELFKGDGTFCVVCSSWHFDNDVDLKKEGLLKFMKSHYVIGNDETYYDYIEDFKTKKTKDLSYPIQAALDKVYFINTSLTRDYVTTFTYVKGKNEIANLLAKGKGASPGIALSAIGLGIALVTGPGGWVAYAGYALATSGGLLAYLGSYYKRAQPEWVAFVTFRGLDKNNLKDLGCDILPAKQNINKP